MADEEKKEEGEETKKSGGPLDNKVILLGAIILAQAILAVGLTQFVIVPKLERIAMVNEEPAVEEEVAEEAEERREGVIVGLNEVVVSLRDNGPTTSYLRINIDLEVADPKVAETVATRLPHLRDIVILALSNKFSTDLRSMDGKSALKAELLRKLGEVLPEDGLWNIYFSDMVVQ